MKRWALIVQPRVGGFPGCVNASKNRFLDFTRMAPKGAILAALQMTKLNDGLLYLRLFFFLMGAG